jgi:hypothetical protein
MALFLLLIIVAIALGIFGVVVKGLFLPSDHRRGRPHCRHRLGGCAAPPKRQAPWPVSR